MWRGDAIVAGLGGPPVAAAQANPAATPPANSRLDAQLFYQLLIGEIELRSGEAGSAYQIVLDAARREFTEETGFTVDAPATPLGHVRLTSGKTVHAFAAEGDLDASRIRSNTFELEWPRGSGRRRTYPEVDRAAWFDLVEARRRILPVQASLLDALARVLAQ